MDCFRGRLADRGIEEMTEKPMKEMSFVDKSKWPEGRWKQEPDKVQWIDESSGLDCLAVRHRSAGHWCGYVGVAEGHPLFKVDDSKIDDLSVHGGLTFSGLCSEEPNGQGICHVPEEGRPHEIWWLGFDCAHLGDVSPGHLTLIALGGRSEHERYRDLEYVKLECKNLAAQLETAIAVSTKL